LSLTQRLEKIAILGLPPSVYPEMDHFLRFYMHFGNSSSIVIFFFGLPTVHLVQAIMVQSDDEGFKGTGSHNPVIGLKKKP